MTAGFFRGALCLATFFGGLCGVCQGIRAALPFPEVEVVKTKLEHLARYRDSYDTLFLGSSRIYFQIIPSLFDHAAAGRGLPTRSFNAAIAGMRPPEDGFYLDQILRHPPSRLRWVFIELAALRTAVDRDKLDTLRAVYWHDWPRTWLLFRRALELHPDVMKRKWKKRIDPLLEQLAEFLPHLRLFLRNQLNLGRATVLTAYLEAHPPAAIPGDGLAGWSPTGRPEAMNAAELARFEKSLADRRREKAVRTTADATSREALEEMIAKVERLGATPVLIVPPTTNRRNFVPAPERERKTLVLDFSDPEKYPELYEPRYRLDPDHLNTAGSEKFTQMLVEAWAEEVPQRP